MISIYPKKYENLYNYIIFSIRYLILEFKHVTKVVFYKLVFIELPIRMIVLVECRIQTIILNIYKMHAESFVILNFVNLTKYILTSSPHTPTHTHHNFHVPTHNKCTLNTLLTPHKSDVI